MHLANEKEVKLKIAAAIFLTLCYRTPAASGLTHVQVHFFTPHQPNYTIRHVKTEKRYLLFQFSKNHYNKILMIYNNILEAMGHTPIIQLQKMVTPDMARVLVKFEGLNVGGSIKNRTAAV